MMNRWAPYAVQVAKYRPEVEVAWKKRWALEFEHTRWVLREGFAKYYPAPGWEPVNVARLIRSKPGPA